MKDITVTGGWEGGRSFLFSSSLDTKTRVWFEAAQVAAMVREEGLLDYADGDGTVFAQAELPKSEDGDGVYKNVKCSMVDNIISLHFPRYTWIDHYPHCDGEYDRWSAVIRGWHTVELDLNARTVRLTESKG